MLAKSPLTSTLKVLTPFTSRCDATVFSPFSIPIASFAKFWIFVSPALLMLERSFLATPVIVAVMPLTTLPLPSV